MATASDVCGFCFEESVYGFCENCSQRLCSSCFSTHSRASRHNTIPINSKYDAVSREVDIHEQKCPRHKTDYQSLYCEKHDATICGRCVLSDHLGCGDSIIDLYDNAVDEDCVNESCSALKQCERELNEIKAGVLENNTSNDVCKTTYQNSIKEFRKSIDARLDQLQSIVESAGERKHKENNRALRAVEDKINDTLRLIQERTNFINELTDKNMRRYLYIVSRRQKKEIININATIKQSHLDNHVEKFVFAKYSKLDTILNKEIHEFGSLIEECVDSEEFSECVTDTESSNPVTLRDNLPKPHAKRDVIDPSANETYSERENISGIRGVNEDGVSNDEYTVEHQGKTWCLKNKRTRILFPQRLLHASSSVVLTSPNALLADGVYYKIQTTARKPKLEKVDSVIK